MPKRKRRASDSWESPKKKMRSSDRTEPSKRKKRSKCGEYNRYTEDDEMEEGSIMWSIVMTCMIIIAAIKVVMN